MKVMLDEGAKMPTRGHQADAGYDLYSRENVVIYHGDSYSFDTGVHLQIPIGYGAIIVSKSGLNDKYSVQSTGLIDAEYTGAIKVKLYNHGHAAVRIEKGQKISQFVIVPVLTPDLDLTDHMEETERGDGGFGSTGKF